MRGLWMRIWNLIHPPPAPPPVTPREEHEQAQEALDRLRRDEARVQRLIRDYQSDSYNRRSP
jgi:hypothetical protein